MIVVIEDNGDVWSPVVIDTTLDVTSETGLSEQYTILSAEIEGDVATVITLPFPLHQVLRHQDPQPKKRIDF